MSGQPIYKHHVFTHHGRTFLIEADGWPDNEGAGAALIDLQLWALQLGPEETAGLHGALEQEREALVHETFHDRDAAPLPAVRDAQRRAVQTGLQGQRAGELQPTVTIEAWQVRRADA